MSASPSDSQGRHVALALDAASLYYRAFFGNKRPKSTADGVPNGALTGFLGTLTRLITQYQPTHVLVAWDQQWRPTWRTALIPEYKAARVGEGGAEDAPADLVAQVPLIHETCTALGIAPIGVPDMEADDVLASAASAWSALHGSGSSIIIASGDRDSFSLIDDAAGVSVAYPAKGEFTLVDQAGLAEKHGVDTGTAYFEMSLLRGDSSDGLPGVKGIGDKTARTLLEKHGPLDDLLQAAGRGVPGISPAKRDALVASRDYIALARQVVTARRDLPLGAEPFTPVAALAATSGQLVDAPQASHFGITRQLAALHAAGQ